MTEFVLAGGCFWCLDACFSHLKGVTESTVGYCGGELANPSYERVCDGNTGHAEVNKVVFDESVISAETILDIFFTLHDPRQLNRQGNDVGTQYRSAMFYADQNQAELFEAAILRASEIWDGPVVTTLEPLQKFWVAEGYHQDYFEQNPGNGYCQAVVAPKAAKVRAKFANLYTD
jgi:peptide-methionine (S)-S-oxide reductase